MIPNDKKLPAINGLVLAGGMSSRMGNPKDKIQWHGKEQRYYMADLLAPFCDEVYISCRQDQLDDFDQQYHALPDIFQKIGPYGGLLSAFSTEENKAWLIIACDLPLLDAEALNFLISCRAADKIATTFINPSDGLPEPLITIWEPESYPLLVTNLRSGITSLRKVLLHNDICTVTPLDPDILRNVNTPEEMVAVKTILNAKQSAHR